MELGRILYNILHIPIHLCMGFFIMDIRLIVHYSDGNTFTGDWNLFYDFIKLNSKKISSLQIQTSNENLYTLSSKKKQNSTYWFRKQNDLISILKRLHKNIWIDLSINKNTEEKLINIISEDIRTK